MSFGFSVGDFLAVIELANKIRKDFKGAPAQFKEISVEVRSLTIVLQDLEDVSEHKLNEQETKELQEIEAGCRNVLESLELTLDKCHELEPGLKGDTKSVKRIWRRLRWDPDDIRDLRSRLMVNVALWNAFHAKIDRQISHATKMAVDHLVERQDDQERQIILEWLTPIDYAPQQSDFINRRERGTGQWLIDSNEYQSWLQTPGKTLFCPGNPGAGKSILTAIAIDDLKMQFQNETDVGIAYFYCNFQQQKEQKASNLLASLLKQFTQEMASLPDIVNTLYMKHKDKRTRPSMDELSETLLFVIKSFRKAFIVIDALDECQNSDGHRTQLLKEIFLAQTKSRANIFATSRPLPEIAGNFEGSIILKILAKEEDVRLYLDGYMYRLPAFVSRSTSLQEEIKTRIVVLTEGMFLLAQLHIESLVGKRSARAIQKAIANLPTGPNVYDAAYDNAMERIAGQLRDQEELAKEVLAWIVCAKMPLTTVELQHALAVQVGDCELDEENLPAIEGMVSVCMGLVTIDEEKGIIRLVHFTTQEYFERTKSKWFPNVESEITTSCLTYLSFSQFEDGICHSDEDFENRLQSNKLYRYAALNWGHHAREASIMCQDVQRFLQKQGQVEASLQALQALQALPADQRRWFRRRFEYSQEIPMQMTSLHLTAHFGLDREFKVLLTNHDPDSRNSIGQTPLVYAVMKGHASIVRLLLETGKVNIESRDKDGRTPLLYAIMERHNGIIKLLLETGQIDLELMGEDGKTPLLYSICYKNLDAIKLLVDHGAKIETEDSRGQTPLMFAIHYEYVDGIELLINHGAKLETRGSRGQTPLMFAIHYEYVDGIELLINHGAKLETRDSNGQTPLMCAINGGNYDIIKLLLNTKKTTYELKEGSGRTPPEDATEHKYMSAIKLLLERGTELKNSDSNRQTLLIQAAAKSCEAAVRLLLDLGTSDIDVNFEDIDGRTPLSYAALMGDVAIVEALLEIGKADPSSKDKCGGTPLLYATLGGHTAIVDMLLTTGKAEAELKDNYGRTPLLWAAKSGHKAVVELLLPRAEVEADSTDIHGWTPLSYAAIRGFTDIVDLLLATGKVQPNSKHSISSLLSSQDKSCQADSFPRYRSHEIAKHNGEVWLVEFSHDGKRLASCGEDTTVFIYDVESWDVMGSLVHPDGRIHSLAWSPDDALIVTCASNNVPTLWDTHTGNIEMRLPRLDDQVTIVWAPDGQSFPTGCLDGEKTIFQWNIRGELIYDWCSNHPVAELTVSANGQLLFAIDNQSYVYVYNLLTRELKYKLGWGQRLVSIGISRDSQYLLIRDLRGDVRMIDIATQETTRTFRSGSETECLINAGYGAVNENFVVTGSEEGHIYIWDKETGALIERLEGHKSYCNYVAWNPTDPSMFASAGDDGKVRIWVDMIGAPLESTSEAELPLAIR